MHAGLSVLRRPAVNRLQSSQPTVYFAKLIGGRRSLMGFPSFGGQRAVGLNS